ncbi:cache domain-containing protein [Desulfocurvibacter africanus]|uniref:cache domain-containing protein n=1 Tax=Desulfocurvibacter africanus TaxID=873 RepID=UPI0003F610D6|nr:cache domain-containing protein [Desulfocurvibacter africanus]
MIQGHKDRLQVATHSMALAIGQTLRDADTPEAQIEIIRWLVDPIRFEEDKSGYYFVYRGTMNVALPPKKELQGKDLGQNKDTNGIRYVHEMHRQAEAGGGFVTYIFAKPGMGDQPKLAYSEMIPGTDMWIGTGVYIDNVESQKATIQELDKVVQQNAAASEEMSSTSEELSSQAEQLQQTMTFFKIGAERSARAACPARLTATLAAPKAKLPARLNAGKTRHKKVTLSLDDASDLEFERF